MGLDNNFNSQDSDGNCPCNGICTCSRQKQNPDPKRYSVKRVQKVGDYLIVKINYPDCSTYEGNKIMVYRGCTIVDVATQEAVDPHFSDKEGALSPIARFKPDDEGWMMAETFVYFLTKSQQQPSFS